MVMMVKMMMMMGGTRPSHSHVGVGFPRLLDSDNDDGNDGDDVDDGGTRPPHTHVGVEFPRLLDSEGDDGNYEDDGGTRPPHESCWGRVPPPPLQENLLFLL